MFVKEEMTWNGMFSQEVMEETLFCGMQVMIR